MRRRTVRVGLAVAVAAALASGFLLFLALRPAELATVKPIDIPAERRDEDPPIQIRSPAGGAAPVSPLPPPAAGDEADDDDGSDSGRSDDGGDDDGSDQDDGGSDDDGAGGDDGADDEQDD